MRTFSFNTRSTDYAARLLDTMKQNYGYIAYFNRGNTQEAFQRIFAAAMRAENKAYSDLKPYVKVLARNVMKTHEREIPYDTYNEEGEVAFVFTPLVQCDKYREHDMNDRILETLQEAYLSFPEDFMLLKEMIPCSDAKDVKKPIKNEDLKKIILGLSSECGGEAVFACLRVFFAELSRQKAQAQAKATESASRILELRKADYRLVNQFTDRKWICDKNGVPKGINRSTLSMDGDFNPEFSKFRLAISTVCVIWKIDCSDYYNAIENKIYSEEGVDNEYIHWCGSKFGLTTPAGERLIGVSREAYMEKVRHELILTVLASGLGTIIALSPDNIYLKLTKASSVNVLKVKTVGDRIFTLPMSVQDAIVTRVNA